jgi:hypothetical protein
MDGGMAVVMFILGDVGCSLSGGGSGRATMITSSLTIREIEARNGVGGNWQK